MEGRADADSAPGPVALTRAVDEAVSMARSAGAAWVAVRGTVHTGAIGYHTERAAQYGMAGLGIAAGVPNMGYPGSDRWRGDRDDAGPAAREEPRAPRCFRSAHPGGLSSSGCRWDPWWRIRLAFLRIRRIRRLRGRFSGSGEAR